MVDRDLLEYDSAPQSMPRIERLDPAEGALLRLDVKLDEVADNFSATMNDLKRSVIRTIVVVAALQTVTYAALLYCLYP